MTERSQSTRRWWTLPLVIALVAATYWSGLSNGFVWLDQSEILEEVLIVDEWSEVPGLFTNDRNNPGYHRPIYTLMHSFDKWLWGERPFGFLLSSLLLHLANVALVCVILRQLMSSEWTAALIALAWGLHPVNSAVVGLIHSKADLLFVFGGLCSVWFFLQAVGEHGRRRRSIAWVLAVVAFALALLSKETALAIIIVVILVAGRPRFWSGAELPKRVTVSLRRFAAITWGIALLILALRIGSSSGELSTVSNGELYASTLSLGERVQTFAGVYTDYIRTLILPLKLSIADTVTAFSALDGGGQARVVASAAVAIALQCWAAVKYPWLRIWLVLFNVSLVPVAQLIPILHFRADRFLYLPSLAFVGGLVQCVEHALSKSGAHARHKFFATAFAILWIALASGRIQLRLRDFKDDQALFGAELNHTPDYLEGLSVLGRSLDRAGHHEPAGELLRLSLQDYPGRISYLDKSGAVIAYSYNLLARGRVEDAVEFLESFERLPAKPAHRDELDYNLAVARFRIGEVSSAFAGFDAYHSKYPADPSCLYFLGRSAMLLGKDERARTALSEYLQLSPNAPDRTEVEAWLEELGG